LRTRFVDELVTVTEEKIGNASLLLEQEWTLVEHLIAAWALQRRWRAAHRLVMLTCDRD
jgi:hypothetical protein